MRRLTRSARNTAKLDFVVHSIAFAPQEALEGEFVTTTREAFRTALEISAFSLTQVALAASPLMTEGGSIVTMSYYGAEKVVPNYNVMGVAKAALEASVVISPPISAKTTSASTRSAPARSIRSRPAASKIWARC